MLKSIGGKFYKFYFFEIDNKYNKFFDIFYIKMLIWMFFFFLLLNIFYKYILINNVNCLFINEKFLRSIGKVYFVVV